MNSPSTEKLTIGRFTFATDGGGELVPVPSDRPLQGFVVNESGQSEYSRIHIFTGTDPEERERYRELWETIRTSRNTSVFPPIVDCGSDDAIPYYVSRFPHGEPLPAYLLDSPPWPGQLAARVLCRFIASLRFQNQIPLHQLVISYDSLWVEKTIYGPRLLIGDITASTPGNGSIDNAALMLSVFKDLTKEESHDPAIAELFDKIGKGPMSLNHVEKGLKNFSISGDSRRIEWTEECEPTPFLVSCLARIDLVSGGSLIEKKETSRRGKPPKRRSKDPGRTGNRLIFQTLYRPAIELDSPFRSFGIPVRSIAIWSMAAVLLILICLSLLTDRGRSLFEGVAGKFGDLTYQPALVITPNPEDVPRSGEYRLASKNQVPHLPEETGGDPGEQPDASSRSWEENGNTLSISN